jgi:guanylate kinase
MAGKQKKGKLIIFSAPSGAGKTTLVRYIMSKLENLTFSVSACSRLMRDYETDGKDYHFITVDEFKEKIENKEFIEWEEVYPDHYYGTLYSEVENKRMSGQHVVFDVDVIGGLNIKKIFKDEALAIFIKPPSIEVLKGRLINRGTDKQKNIETRIKKAAYELGFEKDFDVTIINDDLSKAKDEIMKVVLTFLEK